MSESPLTRQGLHPVLADLVRFYCIYIYIYGKLNPALHVLDSVLPVQVSDSVLTGISISPQKK